MTTKKRSLVKKSTTTKTKKKSASSLKKSSVTKKRKLSTANKIKVNKSSPKKYLSKSLATQTIPKKVSKEQKQMEEKTNENHIHSSAPVPESIISEGAPQKGIPYKNEEYVSSAAINKDAKTAKGLRKPRSTTTHTFTAANHSRRSSSHK